MTKGNNKELMKIESPSKLSYGISKIRGLPFDKLVVAYYQRPYKWNIKNVNQLISDLIEAQKDSEYRLGTIILFKRDDNKYEIVDGQQRIITLSILLYRLLKKFNKYNNEKFLNFYNKLNKFWVNTKFKNPISIQHVKNNLAAIDERLGDLDEDFLIFLLSECEVVFIELSEISEAFQFFDSQNARGKDLEPHDLLKAFHLREMQGDSLSKEDEENIKNWEEYDSKDLSELFLCLYRIKRWIKGKDAKFFTKDNVDTFKGISIRNHYSPPCYSPEIYCHNFASLSHTIIAFPFQLDQIVLNGSRFFEMIKHYADLYKQIKTSRFFEQYCLPDDPSSASEIIGFLNKYGNKSRTGDLYVRDYFDCLLLFYVDRFGLSEEINKVVRKIFLFSYLIRLSMHTVQLASVDSRAKDSLILRTIRDGLTPYDVINLAKPPLEKPASNADGDLLWFYKKTSNNNSSLNENENK